MLEGGDQEKIKREGFSLLDMKRFAESRGYETKGFGITDEVLDRLTIPTVTLMNTRGYSHFVVLKGARDDKVFLADPALGNRVMSRGEFVDEWSGVVLFVAAERDDDTASPLKRLVAQNPAPEEDVHNLQYLGLRNQIGMSTFLRVNTPTNFRLEF